MDSTRKCSSQSRHEGLTCPLKWSKRIENFENGVDHDHDPIQFKANYTEMKLNIGFYLRKREINKNSSFSVRG